MNGWLVVNHYLNTDKFAEIAAWLGRAAAAHNITLKKYTNTGLIGMLGADPAAAINAAGARPDFVLFWDKDIRLAALLESCGLAVYNSSTAIEACDDKSLMYIRLLNSGVKMPRTILSPKTFFDTAAPDPAFIERIGDELGYPLVVKECCGSFGEQVYLARDSAELAEKMTAAGTTPLVFQELIETSFGRDIRINIVGGEYAACMYRFSENGDFRANITGGGSMRAYAPSKEQISVAVRAAEALGLSFAGADILFGRDDEPVLCEVNSNAHFINMYKCTGVNVAESIMAFLARQAG